VQRRAQPRPQQRRGERSTDDESNEKPESVHVH